MKAPHEPKTPAKAVGRRFTTIPELLNEEQFTPEVRQRYEELEAETGEGEEPTRR